MESCSRRRRSRSSSDGTDRRAKKRARRRSPSPGPSRRQGRHYRSSSDSSVFPCSWHVAGFLSYAVLSLWLVLKIILFCEVWVFSLVTNLTSGIVRFWPSVTGACGGCAVWAASVALIELGQHLLRLLVPPPAMAGQGVGHSTLGAQLQLLFVGLPGGPVCDLMPPCPLVALYSFVLPLLSLSFDVCRGLGWRC